jgi:Tfp pilus assembly protein PilV
VRRRGRRPPRAPGEGFATVELLVAIMVFAVGVLALVGSSAAVTRMMGAGAQQTLAATVAQSRFDRLRGASCSAVTGGADTTRGVYVQWSTAPVTRGVSVTVAVRYDTPTGRKTRTFRSLLVC